MSSGPGLLLVMTEFPPSFGGMQTHAIYLARALVERGYRVQVVTQRSVRTQVRLQARQLDRELPFPVLRILSRIGHYHNLALIEQAARAWRAQLIYCSTVFYGELAERLGLPLLCRSVGNDVLRPWIGYPFRPLSRLMSQRHVERLAHLVHRGLERGDALELLFQQRRREVMIDSARRHTTIFANSQFTAEALREIGVGRERIEIVVGGVDAQRFGDETAERTALQIPQGRSRPRTPAGSLARSMGFAWGRFGLLRVCWVSLGVAWVSLGGA